MTANDGEYIDAADGHRAWIDEQMKPAVRLRKLAKHCSGSERRKLELEAIEIESRVDQSRAALKSLEAKRDSRGIEIRLDGVMTESIRNERIQFLTKAEESTRTLRGHAAVFYSPSDSGTEYGLATNLMERIERGAFTKSLADKQHDVKALWAHEAAQPLASTKAMTLRLSEDAKGLSFELLPDTGTTFGVNLSSMVRRGDIRGCSFSFKVVAQKMSREFGNDIRTLTALHLVEISPVAFPAYKSAYIQ